MSIPEEVVNAAFEMLVQAASTQYVVPSSASILTRG